MPRALGLDGSRIGVVLRPPADVALYHRFENPLFDELLGRPGRAARTCARWCCRARPSRPTRIRALALPSVLVPDGAVDGQSLLAGADLVVSAGGTMNREAVVLGTPVYTTFAGRLGGVDERLIAEGRLRPLALARTSWCVERKSGVAAERRRRDPERLIDLAFEGLTSSRGRRRMIRTSGVDRRALRVGGRHAVERPGAPGARRRSAPHSRWTATAVTGSARGAEMSADRTGEATCRPPSHGRRRRCRARRPARGDSHSPDQEASRSARSARAARP